MFKSMIPNIECKNKKLFCNMKALIGHNVKNVDLQPFHP